MAVPPGADVYVDVTAEVTTAEEIVTQFAVVRMLISSVKKKKEPLSR